MALRNKKTVSIVFVVVIAVASTFLFTQRTHAPAAKTTSETAKTTTTQSNDQGKDAVVTPPFDKKQLSIDSPESSWVVVNKTRPLDPLSYAPTDLVAVGGGQQLRSEAATAFLKMQTAAKNEGLNLLPMSGYRSYATQVSVYNSEVKAHGQKVADTQSARPGTSEHQTGWALDVGGGGCGIEDCFGSTEEGKWVAAHGYEYGFIIRYTPEFQQVTGYRAEPWHLRYVGTVLSQELHSQNVQALEIFFGLPDAPDYK